MKNEIQKWQEKLNTIGNDAPARKYQSSEYAPKTTANFADAFRGNQNDLRYLYVDHPENRRINRLFSSATAEDADGISYRIGFGQVRGTDITQNATRVFSLLKMQV